MHLVAHDDLPLVSKVVEDLIDARIQNRRVKQVAFIAREENTHHLRKVISAILGQRMPQQMFYPATNMTMDQRFRQRLEIEVSAGVIDRVGQILPGIRKRTIQVEHHELNRFLHSTRGSSNGVSDTLLER